MRCDHSGGGNLNAGARRRAPGLVHPASKARCVCVCHSLTQLDKCGNLKWCALYPQIALMIECARFAYGHSRELDLFLSRRCVYCAHRKLISSQASK